MRFASRWANRTGSVDHASQYANAARASAATERPDVVGGFDFVQRGVEFVVCLIAAGQVGEQRGLAGDLGVQQLTADLNADRAGWCECVGAA
jgi:hypothetical protein